MTDNPLGKAAVYPQHYQPQLLVRLSRQDNRQLLGIDGNDLPFQGADVWNAWEISCLDQRGKPLAFVGRFVFPAESECLVESKSLKLYLNSLNQEHMATPDDLVATLGRDLSAAAGGNVAISLLRPDAVDMPDMPAGICLDELDIATDVYEVSRALLESKSDALFEEVTEEVLYTHLFRSNCPITNQPDWATLTVCYRGRKIPGELLLKYLVSYRRHNDYHENCVERIFCDLMAVFNPQSLTVEANFLRRGGLDINPVRTTETGLNYLAFPRYSRQ
jgi:7-cyano-7-deazaguanine reductase